MTTPAQEFLRRAVSKSADLAQRKTIRHAIDQYNRSVSAGRQRFMDWQSARQRCHEIKRDAIENLDGYLREFEQRLRARGGQVFWAETSADAQDYIRRLAQRHGVRTVVKAKSMVTEEIHLTRALEQVGVQVCETDLGEFIVQLRQEPPYHIVTPAMHLSRSDIAQLFREKLGPVDDNDPEKLVAIARQVLRKKFFSAEMGISGANFLVADCGMIAITTNEGNDRLLTSIPPIHVAVAGIEKIIPRLEDLAVFWPVLATAGTGQSLTVYNTLIGGPRMSHETDGPEEFHLVLLDNGRSQLLGDTEQREVLYCIRCGACLNACPVFHTIGGHTYGTTYSGPIGSVLTPSLRGLNEFQHLSQASSLCGACSEACPVKIDLHRHLLENRRKAVETASRPWSERVGFRLWRMAMMSSRRFAFLGWVARLMMRASYRCGWQGTWLDPARMWTEYRSALPIPTRSFRAQWRKDFARD